MQDNTTAPQSINTDPPPALYLFASVDIVGSTTFKTKASMDGTGGGPVWLEFFKEFFSTFPSKLAAAEIEHRKSLAIHAKENTEGKDHLNGERLSQKKFRHFQIWKTAGDELLFYKQIDGASDVWLAVRSFKTAVEHMMSQMNEGWKVNSNRPRYVKATAWVAGTPLRNAVVTLGRPDDIDFIGPSIDSGFRLCQFASLHRFVLSLPLTWMIATYQEAIKPPDTLRLAYYGRQVLRGANSGDNYPVFSVYVSSIESGLSNSLSKEEHYLMDHELQADVHILRFTNAFFDLPSSSLKRPFILNDYDQGFFSPNENTRNAYFKEMKTLQEATHQASINRNTQQGVTSGNSAKFINELNLSKLSKNSRRKK